MRKIYSLVLTVAALLIGTNAWGVSVSSGADLKTQMESANNTGNTVNIELASDVTLSSVVQICSHINYSVKPTINLDLKGHTLTVNVTTKENDQYKPFQLYRGTLNILSTDEEGNNIEGSIISNNASTDLISVFGYKNDTTEWSKLEIAESVRIVSNGTKSNAITLDGFTSKMKHAYVNVFNASGVECDIENYVYPELINTTKPHDKAYTMQIYSAATGDTKKSISQKNYYPLIDYAKVGYTTERPYYRESDLVGYVEHESTRYPVYGYNGGLSRGHHSSVYGAKVVINGYVYGEYYGIKVNGTVTDKDGNIPSVLVSGSAEVACKPTETKATAIYASGYANWTINGYVHGSTGVYVKGGNVTIDGATVVSENETLIPTEGTTSGIKSGGSAIVVESNSSYPNGQNVTITGDATITGAGGYGIYETVTTGQQGDIEAVVISGATVEGGSAGSIAVATTSGQTVVYSGNIEGTVTDESGDPTTVSLSDLIPEDVHTTPIYGSDGKKIGDVVSEGAAPTGNASIAAAYQDWVDAGSVVGNEPSVKWTNIDPAGETISQNMKLKELEINETYLDGTKTKPKAQYLTIASGYTLEVGKVILGKAAVITVEAGARLLVTGEDGIYSLEKTNIVLKANATNQATFIIGPNVSSNRQPHATVEYVPNAYMKNDAAHTKVYQRFTSPLTSVTAAPDNNSGSMSIQYVDGDDHLKTYVSYYDGATGWVNLTSWTQLPAFRACAISNNTPQNTNVAYTFKGKLMGNVTDTIAFRNAYWNYFGNSFIAPMSIKSLIEATATARLEGKNIDGSIYLWNVANQAYTLVNPQMALFETVPVEIPALQCFVIRLWNGNSSDFDINYDETVYDYNLHPENYQYSAAPARMLSGMSAVRINIESENGDKDAVYIIESSNYSADYDYSADAVKMMNENGVNMYVDDENEDLAMLATDNVQGTILSLQTTEDINYTLTFDKVRGEIYALRDNLTNAVVLMNEGATYNFTAQSNANLEGRFQIVSRQEMPTAVETMEETVAPKAIYTIMGQYVGETTDWNTLPAGVYVVDGVKIIK